VQGLVIKQIVAETYATMCADNSCLIEPLYFTAKSSIKVSHPNSMAYYLSATLSGRKIVDIGQLALR
jgi:hypothetical protein